MKLVWHQSKLNVKEISENFVVLILRLFDFLPDLVDDFGEFILNIISVEFFWTEVAQDKENFFSGSIAE